MSEEIKKDEELKEETVVNNEDAVSKESEENTEEIKSENEIDKIKEQLKISEDKYLRTYAEFENIKKRLEKEKFQAIDYASEKFARDLLTPIDTLEMALQSANAEQNTDALLEKLKEGIELTIKNFKTVFEKHNISEVDTDCEFDPNYHNAVMQVNNEDLEDGKIVQVMQKGYQFKDRLLRPAMVSINKK